jgi:hypothetical protein
MEQYNDKEQLICRHYLKGELKSEEITSKLKQYKCNINKVRRTSKPLKLESVHERFT